MHRILDFLKIKINFYIVDYLFFLIFWIYIGYLLI